MPTKEQLRAVLLGKLPPFLLDRDDSFFALFALIAMLFVSAACGEMNKRAWLASPESAKIACDSGSEAACAFLRDNGYWTQQYADSGSGIATADTPLAK